MAEDPADRATNDAKPIVSQQVRRLSICHAPECLDYREVSCACGMNQQCLNCGWGSGASPCSCDGVLR